MHRLHRQVAGTSVIAINAAAAGLLDAFANSLRARGSPQTVRRYVSACELLLPTLKERQLYALSARDIQSTLSRLHANGLQPRSIATTLSAWRAWFRYLSKDDPRYGLEIFSTIRTPRAEKRLPNALNEDEAVQLLDTRHVHADAAAIDSGQHRAHATRDQAMFELLYSCGMRVGELTALDLNDIERAAGELRVRGKGRKERVLPLAGAAARALDAWLSERPSIVATCSSGDDSMALFLGSRGGRIHATVVRKALQARAQRQGLASHVHPHRLRHSFASHLLQASGDLRGVQELMGHASIASTQVYTHLDFKRLAAVYDAAHPRARKKAKK
jgi:integrase/recombinase XerC